MCQSFAFYVYILTNQQKSVLYTGLTNNLPLRIMEHWQNQCNPTTFTGRYNVHFLLFFEEHKYIDKAIAREKEIKGWSRRKKCDLINSFNPQWTFLNKKVLGEWPPRQVLNRFLKR